MIFFLGGGGGGGGGTPVLWVHIFRGSFVSLKWYFPHSDSTFKSLKHVFNDVLSLEDPDMIFLGVEHSTGKFISWGCKTVT